MTFVPLQDQLFQLPVVPHGQSIRIRWSVYRRFSKTQTQDHVFQRCSCGQLHNFRSKEMRTLTLTTSGGDIMEPVVPNTARVLLPPKSSTTMFTTNITIPGTSATHIIGETSVDLANGDLQLVLAPPSESYKTGKRPVLTLSVDKVAFPLYETTAFGTVDGDERVYVFQPELGADIKGYDRPSLLTALLNSLPIFEFVHQVYQNNTTRRR